MLREFKTETTVEKQVLTAFIVSNDLLHDFADMTKPEYFESSYIREVVRWTLDYYRKHQEAPRTYIQQIFDYKVADKKIEAPHAHLIEQLLTELSTQFEVQNDVNVEYHAEIIEGYFKKRELEITLNHVRSLIDEDRVDDAEVTMVGYSKIARTFEDFVNPFDEDVIRQTFEERNNDFFSFPGQLGEFLGGFERGWLVGLSGPFKRGKTWYAQEFAVQAMLSFRKVMFFSLEMSKKQMNERLYKRLTATGDEAGAYQYPIFDCKYNQTNRCMRPERENRMGLNQAFEEGEWEEIPPDFIPNSPYQVCTACRRSPDLDNLYFPAVWYEQRRRPEYDERRIALKLKNLQMYFPYLQYKCYPRFSANVEDIKRDLKMIEYLHNFIPDVIVVDYADILRPEDGLIDGFQKEDRTWIALSQLAMERNCLVVTPTQVTKAGQDATQVGVKHQARWVGKLGHVDAMMALNQTEKEQNKGIMRISQIAHRHEKFSPSHNCIVLQNLDLGQPHLDSEIQRYEEQTNDEDED
jgi:replicative DNA helicase